MASQKQPMAKLMRLVRILKVWLPHIRILEPRKFRNRLLEEMVEWVVRQQVEKDRERELPKLSERWQWLVLRMDRDPRPANAVWAGRENYRTSAIVVSSIFLAM